MASPDKNSAEQVAEHLAQQLDRASNLLNDAPVSQENRIAQTIDEDGNLISYFETDKNGKPILLYRFGESSTEAYPTENNPFERK